MMPNVNAKSTGGDLEALKAVEIPVFERRGGAERRALSLSVESGEGKIENFPAGSDAIKQLADLQQAHQAVLNNLSAALDDMDQHYRSECSGFLERLLEAIAPALAQQSTIAEITQATEDYVTRREMPILIRLHPGFGSVSVGAEIEDLQKNPLVKIETDENLNPNAVDLRWRTGGMFSDPDSLISEILDLLKKDL